jgi:hypothetical protein
MMQQHALVLLGCRGSGKDTLYQQFASDPAHFGAVRNCKFSELTKSLVASAFGVRREDLEDKLLRTTPVNPDYLGDLTTLDLLDALYHATHLSSSSCRRLAEANVKYTVARAKASKAPLLVFTDVRRKAEAEAVAREFPYTALHLHRVGTYPTDTDKGILDASDVLDACHYTIKSGESPEQTYTKVKTLLQKLEN